MCVDRRRLAARSRFLRRRCVWSLGEAADAARVQFERAVQELFVLKRADAGGLSLEVLDRSAADGCPLAARAFPPRRARQPRRLRQRLIEPDGQPAVRRLDRFERVA